MGLFDLAEGREQTLEEEDIVKHVRQKLEESRTASNRISAESIWMSNCAYVLGFDGVSYNSMTRTFQPINRGSQFVKKNRIHMNKILPTLQNRLARLCKNPPRYDVIPNSSDSQDKDAARLGLQVLKSLWRTLSIDEKRLVLYMWVQQCGHAYMKLSWDEQLGKEMVDPTTGEMSYEGDVRADIVSPFEVYPDPLAKTWEDVSRSWLIQVKVRKLDYFKTQYPEKGQLVKTEEGWLTGLQFEQRINTLSTRGSTGPTDAAKNTAVEIIKYEARSKDHPNGRMIITAGGILLEDKELPCGEIPFAKFDDVVIGGKYFSESIVTHLRPLQDQYNETIRRRADWVRKFLAGKVFAWRGSGLQQEGYNDQSGEIVWVTPVPNAPGGGAPIPIQPPALPQWAYNETDYLDRMINEVSGISEISKGNAEGLASVPAIGMQLLVEQDDTRIGVITEQHERAWARYGHLILRYVEKFYVLPRKIKVVGRNMEYQLQDVAGQDLYGNTDVHVVRGSSIPGSKVLERQDILNLYREGLMGDPADPKVREKVLGLVEFGDISGVWEDYALDMSQIKRGIEQLEQGVIIPVSELDNHALWIQELNRYRKKTKFEQLDPVIKQNILENIEEHLQYILKQSGAAAGEPNPVVEEPPLPMPEPVQGESL